MWWSAPALFPRPMLPEVPFFKMAESPQDVVPDNPFFYVPDFRLS